MITFLFFKIRHCRSSKCIIPNSYETLELMCCASSGSSNSAIPNLQQSSDATTLVACSSVIRISFASHSFRPIPSMADLMLPCSAIACGLRGEQRRVASGAGEQLVVRAVLADPAVLDHEDAVGVAHWREPVRD